MKKIQLLITLLLITISASSQEAFFLDPSFGINGLKTLDLGFTMYELKNITIDSDGKIVVFGHLIDSAPVQSFIMRFNPDGSVDNDFGANGLAFCEFARDFLTLPNGKLMTMHEHSITQYNNDGSLDLDFGNSGIIYRHKPTAVIQNDGKIIVASNFFNVSVYKIKLERYNPNGTLDTAFNADNTLFGEVVSSLSEDYPVKLMIRSDGKIVLVEEFVTNYYKSFKIHLINPDGSPDGITITSQPNYLANGTFYGLENDDKLLVMAFEGTTRKIKQYNSNFSLDTTYGTTGAVTFPYNLRSVQLQDDNKPLFIAAIDTNDEYIYRMTTDGSVDTTFNNTGMQFLQIGLDNAITYTYCVSGDAIFTIGKPIPAISGVGFYVAKLKLSNELGNNQNQSSHQYSLYPNPAKHDITITNAATGSMTITDITGKIIIREQLSFDSKVNVDSLVKGIYFVSINNTKPIKFIKS